MTEETTFHLNGGLAVSLGYRRRPFEPASVKYNWVNFAGPAVDLNQPRVFWGTKPDPRLKILDQKNMGSCSSFGAADAVTAAAKLNGVAAVELMHDWLYEMARKKEGTFPQDAGSDPADILDSCKAGAPPESDQPGGYVDNPAATFDQYTADAKLQYVTSYHAIYPKDAPNMETLVWSALDGGNPVVVATEWTNAFFYPTGGKLPSGQEPSQGIGGHCIYCWGIVPGYYLCDNSWTAGWSADATASGFPGMRPGSFAIPWEYGHPRSLIDMMWVIVGANAPSPQPTPTPVLTASISGPTALTPGQSGQYVVGGTGATKPMYGIKWGDGTTNGWAVSGSFSHSYAAAGTYTIQGLIGDQVTNQISQPATMTVTVSTAPTPPPPGPGRQITSAAVMFDDGTMQTLHP